MDYSSQFDGIRRARTAAADTLVEAISNLPPSFSEQDLATAWLDAIRRNHSVLPRGWYNPPPHGIAVLIGEPPQYKRLDYKSLRSAENFPSNHVRYCPKSIIYPYFSAIDKQTGMIGDQVGTYYAGADPAIREWLRQAYHTTKDIISLAHPGLSFSELHERADLLIKECGASNNTLSISSGLAADIGHSIPYFGDNIAAYEEEIEKKIANGREFVRRDNINVIGINSAFTIEPQFLAEGLPMASFHFIVVIIDGEPNLISIFDRIFAYFGMDAWI